jgi:putative NIF3 family GTP cyclohydrolase 1 type 2
MKVKDILEHFLSHADWVDRQTTVDRVIVGDAETEVGICLVTWMPTFRVLRHMVERNIRLLICHEPTFWNHWDKRLENDAGIQEKLKFILDNKLVILRNHDCWDRWPDVGIPWAWAGFLDLGNKPVDIGADGYQHRYDIDPVPLKAFARGVAGKCASLGEPLVQVTGDDSQVVSRIGIGTGCGCDISIYQRMNCDCSIVCDDGTLYWEGIQRAEEAGHPVIRVNHGTSEEPGMVTLTEYINTQLDGLHAEHLPHGCTFHLLGN